MTPDLATLIERLEKASGPDWELDIEIGEIIFPEQYKALCEDFEKTWKRAQENGLHDRRLACWRSTFQGVWRFTYSIDAALTLVPEGWRWRVERYNTDETKCNAELAEVGQIRDFGIGIKTRAQASGPTPAIALCIASLRARLELTKEGVRS